MGSKEKLIRFESFKHHINLYNHTYSDLEDPSLEPDLDLDEDPDLESDLLPLLDLKFSYNKNNKWFKPSFAAAFTNDLTRKWLIMLKY